MGFVFKKRRSISTSHSSHPKSIVPEFLMKKGCVYSTTTSKLHPNPVQAFSVTDTK